MLFSHLSRAALFGAAAGWLSSLLGGVVDGWLLYLGCAALAGAGGWVLARPMERDSWLAVAVLWAVAGYLFQALRPPVDVGVLAVGESIGGYVELGGVLAGMGIGAFIGRAFARA